MLAEPNKVALPDWAVALVAGLAVAIFLLTVALIELVAEGNLETRHLLLKVGGAVFSVAAALGAAVFGVSGSLLLIGAMLAMMVGYGVHVENRLYKKL
jgi:hypothetical protein